MLIGENQEQFSRLKVVTNKLTGANNDFLFVACNFEKMAKTDFRAEYCFISSSHFNSCNRLYNKLAASTPVAVIFHKYNKNVMNNCIHCGIENFIFFESESVALAQIEAFLLKNNNSILDSLKLSAIADDFYGKLNPDPVDFFYNCSQIVNAKVFAVHLNGTHFFDILGISDKGSLKADFKIIFENIDKSIVNRSARTLTFIDVKNDIENNIGLNFFKKTGYGNIILKKIISNNTNSEDVYLSLMISSSAVATEKLFEAIDYIAFIYRAIFIDKKSSKAVLIDKSTDEVIKSSSGIFDKKFKEKCKSDKELFFKLNDFALLTFNQDCVVEKVEASDFIMESFGFNLNIYRGKMASDLFDKNRGAQLFDLINQTGKTGNSNSTIFPISTLTGNYWIKIDLYYTHKDKKIIAIIKDITEFKKTEKALERAKNYLEKVFFSVADAIFIIDSKLIIRDCNKAFEEKFGYEKSEIIGESIEMLYLNKQEYTLSGQYIKKEIDKSSKYYSEIYFKDRGGNVIISNTIMTVIKDAYETGDAIAVVVSDITERKVLEDELLSQTKQIIKSGEETEAVREYLETIFNNVADAIIILDKKGVITDCNESAEKMFQMLKNKLVGYNISQLSAGSNINVDYILSKEKEKRFDCSFTKHDGTIFYATVSLTHLFIETSNIQGHVLVIHDKTKEKESQQRLLMSEEKFRSMFEASKEIIFLLNTDLTVANINPFVTDYLGFKQEFLEGRNIGEIFYKNDKDRQRVFTNQTLKTGTFRGEIEINKYRSNTFVTLDCSISSVKDNQGKYIFFVAFLRDITERKKVEILKDDFVSSVSHELRTPLTSILGSLRLLQAGITEGNYEKTSSLINLACRSSERLLRIINEILDIERIESGRYKFSFDHFLLITLLNWSVEFSEGLLHKYNVNLKIAKNIPNVYLLVDKNRFIQVLSNLISNALKFSPQFSTVKIDARLIEDNKSIRISVRDKGVGIPVKFRERIFEKFAQADTSYARKNEGTGLGLSISKGIVEHMNGTIGYRTKENKGTVFYVNLPVEQKQNKKTEEVFSARE